MTVELDRDRVVVAVAAARDVAAAVVHAAEAEAEPPRRAGPCGCGSRLAAARAAAGCSSRRHRRRSSPAQPRWPGTSRSGEHEKRLDRLHDQPYRRKSGASARQPSNWSRLQAVVTWSDRQRPFTAAANRSHDHFEQPVDGLAGASYLSLHRDAGNIARREQALDEASSTPRSAASRRRSARRLRAARPAFASCTSAPGSVPPMTA